MEAFRLAKTSLLNDFMTTDVRATGLVILGLFGTGMMMEHLKLEGNLHSSSYLLKIFVKMGVSWSAQILRQAGDTLSGPGPVLLLFSLKTWRTSSSLIFSAGLGERGVAGGVNGCVERCSGWAWGVFPNLQ